MKYIFSRSEYRLVTTYYEVEDEDEDAAYEQFMEGDRVEIGFNIGKLADLDYFEDQFVGNNPPFTDYQWSQS